MKLFIILIVGIFIGTWVGLLLASLVVISKREEEAERQYWEEREMILNNYPSEATASPVIHLQEVKEDGVKDA